MKKGVKLKILYGVQGEGMGHSTRSKAIIDELIKLGHEVHIVTGSRAYFHLSESFKNVLKTTSTHIMYKNNRVDTWGTIVHYVKNIPNYIKTMKKIAKKIDSYKPDVIISDFEPFTTYVSWYKGKPIISLDNEAIQLRTKLDWPWEDLFAYLRSIFVVKTWMPHADYWLITTFFYPPKKGKNVFLFPPILRKSIRDLKVKKGKKILVYQTSKTNKKLLRTLKTLKNYQFVIYGFDRNETVKNCEFRTFADHTSFFNTLAHSRAVIMNGGFSLLSECLYLRKPILSIPVEQQFEQITNARQIEKYGYGMHSKTGSTEDIANFFANLKTYEKNLSKFKREDNSKIIRKLSEIFKEIKK